MINAENPYSPLADRLRPRHIDDFFGQTHLLGPQKTLRQVILQGQLHSMILWGPPGTGKTTLAKLMANHDRQYYFPVPRGLELKISEKLALLKKSEKI